CVVEGIGADLAAANDVAGSALRPGVKYTTIRGRGFKTALGSRRCRADTAAAMKKRAGDGAFFRRSDSVLGA
ncbi:MAG: hypothetical protein VW405_18075, partial [Rhodospirillaceae bacterium]